MQEPISKLQEEEHQQYLLTQESFDKWLYETYTVNNGDMLIDLYEDTDVLLAYLHDHGLPEDSIIEGVTE